MSDRELYHPVQQEIVTSGSLQLKGAYTYWTRKAATTSWDMSLHVRLGSWRGTQAVGVKDRDLPHSPGTHQTVVALDSVRSVKKEEFSAAMAYRNLVTDPGWSTPRLC